jgi:hypothetical protein
MDPVSEHNLFLLLFLFTLSVSCFRVAKESISIVEMPVHLRNTSYSDEWPILNKMPEKDELPLTRKQLSAKRHLDLLAETDYVKEGRCKGDQVKQHTR